MANTTTRSYSRLTRQALNYLGALVRAGRIEKKMNMQELAERVGISRDAVKSGRYSSWPPLLASPCLKLMPKLSSCVIRNWLHVWL
jgi:transcriptional regulator with XRE-family HTH domain